MPATESTPAQSGPIVKLPPIPNGARIQKRAVTRRQPPASSKTRQVYISTKTPFMSAAKRIRKQLDQELRTAPAPKNASIQSRVDALQRMQRAGRENTGTVTVMGTGRAVEKTLRLASWFEQQGDCDVEMRTRTVATVDDVIVQDEDAEDESRIRKMSCLELVIKLK